MKNSCFLYFILFQLTAWAQTGVSVSPPRLYYENGSGQSTTQKVMVTNVSTSNSLDLAVSLGDWEYDLYGENIMHDAQTLPVSCTAWVTIKKEDSYFSLKPGEKKEVEVTLTAPNMPVDTLSVHTAMLYVTQMNPIDDTDAKGSNIKVSIRSGIKLFHKNPGLKKRKLEIKDVVFRKETHDIGLLFENLGNIWTDGKIFLDVLNPQTGKKEHTSTTVFYSLPGNKRSMTFSLPKTLEKGVKYIGTILIDYGDERALEMAELKFTYE